MGAKDRLFVIGGIILALYGLVGLTQCEIYTIVPAGLRRYDFVLIAGELKNFLCFTFIGAAMGFFIFAIPEQTWNKRVSSTGYFERNAVATLFVTISVGLGVMVSIDPHDSLDESFNTSTQQCAEA